MSETQTSNDKKTGDGKSAGSWWGTFGVNVSNGYNDCRESLTTTAYQQKGSYWDWAGSVALYMLVAIFLSVIMALPALDIVVTAGKPKTVLTANDGYTFSGIFSDSHQNNQFVVSHISSSTHSDIVYDISFNGRHKIKNGVSEFNILSDTTLVPHSSYDGSLLAVERRPFHSMVYESEEDNGDTNMIAQFVFNNAEAVNLGETGEIVSNVSPHQMMRVGTGLYLSGIGSDTRVTCLNGETDTSHLEGKLLKIDVNHADREHTSELRAVSLTRMDDVRAYIFPKANDNKTVFILDDDSIYRYRYDSGDWTRESALSVSLDTVLNASLTPIDDDRVVISSNSGITIADFTRDNGMIAYPFSTDNHTNSLVIRQDDDSVLVACIIDNRLHVFDEDMQLRQSQNGQFSHVHQNRIVSYADGPNNYVYYVDSKHNNKIECVNVRSVS
jgi:hypothetical protein